MRIPFLLLPSAEVAELEDALDSKSSGPLAPCGFDSRLRHQSPLHAAPETFEAKDDRPSAKLDEWRRRSDPHRRWRCPGLNAVIRAVTRRALTRAATTWSASARAGAGSSTATSWRSGRARSRASCRAAGTILGTTRTNPYKTRRRRRRRCSRTSRAQGLDALVAIGGEDTLGVAARLYAEHDFPVVGVPKTIDNDLSATDYTFGFDTAVSIATEAIDRLHTTAESHNRVMVVEVMGRHTGWIAVMSGIAGGADVILIPEQPVTVEAGLRGPPPPPRARQGLLDRRRQRGVRAHLRVGRASDRSRRRRLRPTQFGHVRLGGVGDAAGAGDRGAHRLRDARHRARPRAARRDADPARPRARDALRPEGGRPRRTRALRHAWRRSTATTSSTCRCESRGRRAEDRAARLVRGREGLLRLARAARRAGRSGCAAAGRGSSAGASSAGSS